MTTIPAGHPPPPDYRPPRTASELLNRYAAGERYFADAKLRGAILHMANLSGSDFTRADLAGAGLQGVDLANCTLRDADLSGVDCVAAKLRFTDLSGSKLSGGFPDAYFWHTKIAPREVEVIWALNAEFRFVEFTGVAPKSFYVRGAAFNSCSFAWCSLHNLTGAEDAIHEWPSEFNVSTVQRTVDAVEGDIAKAKQVAEFFRGAGVPGPIINAYPSLKAAGTTYQRCFISYSHSDAQFVNQLYSTLKERGVHCWLDKHEMYPGDDTYEEVHRGLQQAERVLLVCSEHSLTSWWVDTEIDEAFEKERQLSKASGRKALVLIPLDVDGYVSKAWRSGKARPVLSRIRGDFTRWQDRETFEREIDRLLAALDVERANQEAG